MNEIIEKKAQVKILYHLFDRLCLGELPETGRKAIRSLIAQLNKEIDDISNFKNNTSGRDGDTNR